MFRLAAASGLVQDAISLVKLGECGLTPRSRGDPTRRGALGPRRAVAGSIVLRGPKAPRLSGRLSSNVRPQTTATVATRSRRYRSGQPLSVPELQEVLVVRFARAQRGVPAALRTAAQALAVWLLLAGSCFSQRANPGRKTFRLVSQRGAGRVESAGR
jgi:hypothetical protein